MADNPFLLPPGSAPSPRSEPPVAPVVAPAAPVAAPASAPLASAQMPAGYIAVPASVESVTHRIARPQTAPVAVQEPEPDDPDDPDVEETRLAAPPQRDVTIPAEPGDRTLWLVLPDGTRVPVDGALLLGRDPAALAERPRAQLLALLDSAKTVSKTHALVEPTGLPEGGLRIRDLYSTNGVAINVGKVRTVLPSGGEGVAPRGAVVELGSFTVMVDSRTQQPTP